jgi:hypothetical protein
MVKLIRLILILFCIRPLFGQINPNASGNIEVYLLDSYITPEHPYKLVVSFLTSDSCFSEIKLLGLKTLRISDKLTDNHRIEFELYELEEKLTSIEYKLYVWIGEHEISESQIYEVEVPKYILLSEESSHGLLQLCCMGGIIFGIPSPTLVIQNDESYFSLTKEIPLFAFYSSNFNYPFGYISLEFAHIFKSERENFLRIGYKQLFQTKPIQYVSLGVSFFSDLNGFNGLSPELSLGLFQIENVITFYSKYRYNFQPTKSTFIPSNGRSDFHEISIGLYSSFFSLNF